MYVDRQRYFSQPLDVDDDDVTVDILRFLVAEGYEGESLIEKYQEVKKKIVSVKDRLDEAELDVAEGRTDSDENMRTRIRATYGV